MIGGGEVSIEEAAQWHAPKSEPATSAGENGGSSMANVPLTETTSAMNRSDTLATDTQIVVGQDRPEGYESGWPDTKGAELTIQPQPLTEMPQQIPVAENVENAEIRDVADEPDQDNQEPDLKINRARSWVMEQLSQADLDEQTRAQLLELGKMDDTQLTYVVNRMLEIVDLQKQTKAALTNIQNQGDSLESGQLEAKRTWQDVVIDMLTDSAFARAFGEHFGAEMRQLFMTMTNEDFIAKLIKELTLAGGGQRRG